MRKVILETTKFVCLLTSVLLIGYNVYLSTEIGAAIIYIALLTFGIESMIFVMVKTINEELNEIKEEKRKGVHYLVTIYKKSWGRSNGRARTFSSNKDLDEIKEDALRKLKRRNVTKIDIHYAQFGLLVYRYTK